MESDVSLFSL